MYSPTFWDLLTHKEHQKLIADKLWSHLFPWKYTGDAWRNFAHNLETQLQQDSWPILATLHATSAGVQSLLNARIFSNAIKGRSDDDIALLTKMWSMDYVAEIDRARRIELSNTLWELELALFLMEDEWKNRLEKSKNPGSDFFNPVLNGMSQKYTPQVSL